MTENETANDRAPIFWAKADRANQERIHPLECHLADVGACFEAILKQQTIRKRVASAGGLDGLDDSAAARLAVFAALHDIGKVNVGFQTRIWQPDARKPRRAGHTADIIPVLNEKDRDASEWFLDALGWDDFLAWDDDGGNTASALFAAAMSHHGEPLNFHSERQANPTIWRPFGGLDPEAQVRRIGNLIRRWFPDAFRRDAQKLPSKPAFQHMFLGLCTLADWIGSNEEYFPYYDEARDAPIDRYMSAARERAARAVLDVGLDIRAQRAEFKGEPGFAALFDHPEPNAIQTAARNIPIDEPLAVVESETGSGKTEAALWRFSRLYAAGLADSLYFALPTRAAAVQIHGRAERFAKRMFADSPAPPDVVLAVPGYIRPEEDAERAPLLHDYNAWWEHSEKPWAARSAKRYLAAQIAVGSVDQAMMAALQVRHSHMRAACLSRSLLVIDEVHASGPGLRTA